MLQFGFWGVSPSFFLFLKKNSNSSFFFFFGCFFSFLPSMSVQTSLMVVGVGAKLPFCPSQLWPKFRLHHHFFFFLSSLMHPEHFFLLHQFKNHTLNPPIKSKKFTMVRKVLVTRMERIVPVGLGVLQLNSESNSTILVWVCWRYLDHLFKFLFLIEVKI